MGMFDWVTYQGREDFQTKDLDNTLSQYEFRDGILFRLQVDSEWIDDPEHRFGGYIKETNPRWVAQYQYSGSVFFYRNTDKTYKVWEEYTAFIIDGKVIKIVDGDGRQ